MATKTPAKKKAVAKAKAPAKTVKTIKRAMPVSKPKLAEVVRVQKPISMAVSPLAARPKESAKEREDREHRREVLQQMLMRKRQEIIKRSKEAWGNPSSRISSAALNRRAMSATKPSWISIAN
ncbi:hypothetical protein EMGBD2_03480 [Nitrospirota bacterium]|nr:hypothetical protein EMGBD2_03480 [Nitrospirota bacterium]